MVSRGLGRYADLGLLIARLGFGLGFVWYHGLPKLRGGPERWVGTGGAMESIGIRFAYEYWGLAAGIAEGIGGLLIASGLFFRPAVAAVAFVVTRAAAANRPDDVAHAF
jgi:putative oxidoreductase